MNYLQTWVEPYVYPAITERNTRQLVVLIRKLSDFFSLRSWVRQFTIKCHLGALTAPGKSVSFYNFPIGTAEALLAPVK